MAHILFITTGVTSYLNASYKIAHQLKARGDQVTFISGMERAEPQVLAQGFDFILLQEEAEVIKQQEAQKQRLPQQRLKRYLNRTEQINVARLRYAYELESQELEQRIAELQPDLLIIDAELSAPIIRAMVLDIPILLIEFHCSPRRAKGVPILYSNLIPTGTFWNQWAMSVTWHFTYLKRQLKFGLARLYYGGVDWMSTLRALARQRGLDFVAEFDLKQWHFITPYRLRTLIAAAWEFDFPHDSEYRNDYIGPLVMLDRQEAVDDPDYQRALQSIAAKKRSGSRRFLIFCSMGTIDSNQDYFRRVIDAIADKPNWDLILAVGHKLPLDHFDPLPNNVYLFQQVPQLDLLSRADVVLNHGGIGTINEAIFLGVPMVVYSDGFLDRNGSAARVAYHALGLRGDFHQDTAVDIANNIERVLTDPHYKANVERMRQIYVTYHQSDRVAQLVQETLMLKEKEPV